MLYRGNKVECPVCKKSFYGTISYMPALFGLMGAAEVIRHLSED